MAFALGMLTAFPAARAEDADCRAGVDISYDTSLRLEVDYRCKSQQPVSFQAMGGPARSYVTDARDGQGRAVSPTDNSWAVDAVGGEARLSYRVDLGALARANDSMQMALARERSITALLGTWLLQPRLAGKTNPVIDIEPHTASADLKFAAGLLRAGGAWRLQDSSVFLAGYTTIGDFELHELRLSSVEDRRVVGAPPPLRLAILPGALATSHADLVDWVNRTAMAEANFWDGFPAPGLLITAVPRPGMARVGFGRVVPGGGATMALEIGSQTERAGLYRDWVLVHEFIHTAMPFVTGRASWLMEGTATWLEPIIRARAGWKPESEVWREWISEMPRGLPGLEQGGSSSRFSVYWSGALVMLMTDLDVRRASGGKIGLEDCLRGVLQDGVRAYDRWSLGRYIARCDALMGGQHLAENVERYVNQGRSFDLAGLWRDLGVSLQDGQVRFDDSAPLAALRRTLVMGSPAHPPRQVALPQGL